MILFEITNSEQNPVYQALEISNGDRLYEFIRSIVEAAVAINRQHISEAVLKAFNHHAIACLHTNAGEYRPCEVVVGTHNPPEHYRVSALMEDFVNNVNRYWHESDPIALATFVLWRLCYIHPFINGNGRTARAACYFVVCVKVGGVLPGSPTLPELITKNRSEYIDALRKADESYDKGAPIDLSALHLLLSKLLQEQANSAAKQAAPVQPATAAALPAPAP